MVKSPKARRKKKNIRRSFYKGQSELSAGLIKFHNKIIKTVFEGFNKSAMEIVSEMIDETFENVYYASLESSYIFSFNILFKNSYEKIMENYKKVAETFLASNDAFEVSINRDIFNGISEIFHTRLNEYEELTKNTPNDFEIPSIPKEAFGLFLSKTETLVRVEFPRLLEYVYGLSLKKRWDISVDSENEILADIKKTAFSYFIPYLYSYYTEGVQEAVYNIDCLSYKSSLSSKLERIKDEYEILSSVIKIQIPKLEDTQTDDVIVQDILYLIRETYQYLGKCIEKLELLYIKSSSSDEMKLNSVQEFEQSILNAVNGLNFENKNDFYSKYDILCKEFKDTFLLSIMRVLKIVQSRIENDDLEDIREDILEEDKVLSDISNSYLKKIIQYTDENYASLKRYEEINIIDGIRETIDIKIQSIEENMSFYAEGLNSKDLEGDALTIEFISEKDYDLIFKYWIEEYSDTLNCTYRDINDVTEFFRFNVKKLSEHTVLQYTRKLKSLREELEKASNNYKRETLLFEISTFEEILNHSISKLKETQSYEIINYCKYIEDIYAQIIDELSRYNIIQINPSEKSLFNAKEHEILMAKEEEGYAKGEIIKVLNKGYKKDTTVLLRANVIAAK